MAVHGAGVTRLAEFVAAPYLASGQLVPLLEHSDAVVEPMDIYACVQERAAMTPKVKAFLDYLSADLIARWPTTNVFVEGFKDTR
jgi:DNA-binding transcriptional LysR family regulator